MKINIINKTILIIILIICNLISMQNVSAQRLTLTLNEVIDLAKLNSFEAYRAKNIFISKAIDYKAGLRSFYPKLTLSLTPAEYSRYILEQWDSEGGKYKPYDIQSLYSNFDLSVNQPIVLTGGTLKLSSYLNRYSSYNDNIKAYTSYISYPLRFSYSQDFAKVNTYKWLKNKIPIEFNEAKAQYVMDLEGVTINAINLFFNLLLAETEWRISLLNKNNADTLYQFGRRKLEIGAITQDYYLQLHLKKINAGLSLEGKTLAREQARLELNNFLDLPRNVIINCVIPNEIKSFEIRPQVALYKVLNNNPNISALNRKLVDLEQAVKQSKRKGFSASFSATVGYNQTQEYILDVYHNLRGQQLVSLTFNIPILDWGDAKRNLIKAQLNKSMAEENEKNFRNEIELQILNLVNEFNLNNKQLKASAKADSIAQVAYEEAGNQFLLGQTSVLDLNGAYHEMQNAQNKYINLLRNYWVQLYFIRKLCLFDFENDVDLDADFDMVIEKYM